ncbi:MAG: hypothetical protein ACOCR1_00130 [Planctomycetota bacterium]
MWELSVTPSDQPNRKHHPGSSRVHSFLTILMTVWLVTVIFQAGCRYVPEFTESEPEWVARPKLARESERFISATGVGRTAPDEEGRLQEADEEAREKLTERLGNYCSDTVTEYFEKSDLPGDDDGKNAEEIAEVVSAETPAALLRRSPRHDTWQNSSTGNISVIYRIPIREINELLLEKTDLLLQDSPGLVEAPEETLSGLENHLDDELKNRMGRTAERDQNNDNGHTRESMEREEVPDWLSRGRTDDFPREEYIAATGIGTDESDARTAGKKSILRTINRRVDNLVDNIKEENAETLVQEIKEMPGESLRLTADQINEVTFRRHWFDTLTNTYYVLVVTDRKDFVTTFRDRAQKNLQQSSEAIETGRKHAKARNLLTATREFMLAYEARTEYIRNSLLAQAAEYRPEKLELENQPLLPDIVSEMQEIAQKFTIEPVGESEYWLSGRDDTSLTLSARVTSQDDNQPIAEVPVTWHFKKGSGEITKRTVADEDGRVDAKVKAAESTDLSYALVECRLNLSQIADVIQLPDVEIPSASFRLMLPQPDNTRFAIHLDPPEIKGYELTADIRETLEEAGYALVDSGQLPQEIKNSEDSTEAAETLRSHVRSDDLDMFVLGVFGEASVEIVDEKETSQGTLYFVHVPMTITVIDPNLPSDQPLLTVSVTGKEAYAGDRDEAIRRAAERATSRARRSLLKSLKEKFTP